MPLQQPSSQIATGIKHVNNKPVDLMYGPFTGATINDAIEAAKTDTQGFRYPSMKVGIIVNNVGYVYYFKDLDTLEPIGSGSGTTGPQGITGLQGPTGPAGSAAASSLKIQYETNLLAYSIPHTFGTIPLITIIDDTGVVLIPGANTQGLTSVQVTETQVTLVFSTGANKKGFVILGGGLTGPQGNTGPQGFTGFQGAQGPTGEVIYAGYQGFTGPQGLTGPQGFTGLQGTTGPQGNTGPQGFTGLQGTTGPQGFTGLQGTTGPQGFTGPQGRTGPQGNTGIQGFTGPQGTTGPQGFTGLQGFTGPQGAMGPTGLVATMVQTVVQWRYQGINPLPNVSGRFSSNASSFATSQQFQFHFNDINSISYENWFGQLQTFVSSGNPSYIQIYDAITVSNTGLYEVTNVTKGTSTYSIFVKNPPIAESGNFAINSIYNVTWVAQGSVGKTGPQGFTGLQGITGAQGFTGPQGFTGLQGFTGPQGSTGAQGFTGAQGNTGPQGNTGAQGATGPVGATGINWRGAYVTTNTYSPNDVVHYFGSSYIAVATASPNQVPSTSLPTAASPTWSMFAQMGQKSGQVWQYLTGLGPSTFGPPAYATGSFGIQSGKVHFNSTSGTFITKMFISFADMSAIVSSNFITSWKTGDIITWTIAFTPFANTSNYTLRVGTVSQILGSASLGYYEVTVQTLAGSPGSTVNGFTNQSLVTLTYQPIGPSTIGTGSAGFLPIYTQDNQGFIGTTVSFSTNPAISTSVSIQATPASYGSAARSYRIPALTANLFGTTEIANTGDFVLSSGDQDITGIKYFRWGLNNSIEPNLDGTWGSMLSTRLLFRRTMFVNAFTNSSAQFQGDMLRIEKAWVNLPSNDSGYISTSRGAHSGGPNNSSILYYLMRNNSSSRTFAKSIYSDEIDYAGYGKTGNGGIWGTENLRTRLTPWNQIIGRSINTMITNDIDPFRSPGFSYSTGDPDHIDNFVFNMHVSRMKTATSSTSVQTLLHHWLRGESAFSDKTTAPVNRVFTSVTQSTLLFVNPQVGGRGNGSDFATASTSIGVFTRHDVDTGYINYAYDFFASRVGNQQAIGGNPSKILHHIGYFAQSKTSVSTSTGLSLSVTQSSVLDPSGRETFNFLSPPTQWGVTYSYPYQPWSFYAESDKANLGGGLLIDRGATFGTSLNAWLEIQSHTSSRAQIRLRPGSGPTPSNLDSGDLWYTGNSLNFYDGTSTYDLITEQNVGQKARLGIYPETGVKLDDGVSWVAGGGSLGTVSVLLNTITDRDWTEETRAVAYINKPSQFFATFGSQMFSIILSTTTQSLIIGTYTNFDSSTYFNLVKVIDIINNNSLGYDATFSSWDGQLGYNGTGFTISITAPYSTLTTRYGSSINGATVSIIGPNQVQWGLSTLPSFTPFSGGTDVQDISYTIPSNNKSQQFVMTEGGQTIAGFKRFTDRQIFFGPTMASATSTISDRMSFGTVSQRGDIAHNPVLAGQTSSWSNYERYVFLGNNNYATFSHGYLSSTFSQRFNIKKEINWQNSLANLVYYDKGVPILYSQRPNNTTPNRKHDRFVIDPRVAVVVPRTSNYYRGHPIINISDWTTFVSDANLSLSDSSFLTSSNRDFTNLTPTELLGGFMIGKGSSIQHNQWNDIGHQADILNFQYTENGGFPSAHYENSYFQLNNSNEDSVFGQGRVRSKNTVHHYLKTVINMDPPVAKGSTISRFNQDRHTNLFIESVGSGNPEYSFGVYHKSSGPHGKISADFFAAKPSNVFYNENFDNVNNMTSSQVAFYAQSKNEIPSFNTDPLGRNFSGSNNTDPWSEDSNSGKFGYEPWSFFAENDRAGFGGGAVLMGPSSSVVRQLLEQEDFGTIYKSTNNQGFDLLGNGRVRNLNGIFFINDNVGWAVGEGGVVRKTTDGGTTWTTYGPEYTGTLNTLNTVYFQNSLIGWVGGVSGTILYTNDGGISWTSRNNTGNVTKIISTSTTTLYYLARLSGLYKSTDAGQTWSLIRATAFSDFHISGARIFLCKPRTNFDTGEYWTTDDDFATFINFQLHSGSFNEANFPNAIFTPYGDTSFVAGRGLAGSGIMIQKVVLTPTPSFSTVFTSTKAVILNSMYFVNSSIGYVVGDFGTILRTIDGGDNWEDITPELPRLKSGYPINLNTVFARSTQKVWIVGDKIATNGQDILKVYPSGLPSWLVIQEPLANKSHIRFLYEDKRALASITFNNPISLETRLLINYPVNNTVIFGSFSFVETTAVNQATELANLLNATGTYSATSTNETVLIYAPEFSGSQINNKIFSFAVGSANVSISAFSGGVNTSSPTSPFDGDLWYTGTALNFKSQGVIYDLLTTGGGAGGQFIIGGGGSGSIAGLRTASYSNTKLITITHSIGQFPLVQVLDENGGVFQPLSITHSSTNAFKVAFGITSSGTILYGGGLTGPQGNTGPQGLQGPTGPTELATVVGPTGSIMVRYSGGWTAFSATTSTNVYLKSNGYDLPVWATVSGGGGSGDVQTGNIWSIPIYSTDGTGTTLDDVVNSTSLVIASQSGNTLTIPNVGGSANFVMTLGSQTIGGTKSFTEQVIVNTNGNTSPQIAITGSNARWIDFGDVGYGAPSTTGVRPSGTKLSLKDDAQASVRIGVQNKTVGLTNSILWLQTARDGSVDFYEDNNLISRFDGNISISGATMSFGTPASSGVLDGRTTNVNFKNFLGTALTVNSTITVPVINNDNTFIVNYINPGFTSSSNAFSNIVVDAYGSLSRGGEIESLGLYSLGTASVQNIMGPTGIARPTAVVPSGGKTIPAYWWTVGKVVTGRYVGTISKNNISGGNVTFTINLGGTTLSSINIPIESNTISIIQPIEIEFMITCRSLGSSGAFVGFLKYKLFNFTISNAVLQSLEAASNGSGPVDTNRDLNLDVFMAQSATTITLTIEQAIIEYKN